MMTEPMEESDGFYGLIHNYIVHKHNGGVEMLPHSLSTLDKPLAIVCDKLKQGFAKKFDNLVNFLCDRELSFVEFVEALDTVFGFKEFEMDYNRALGPIIMCGVYVRKLSEMEEQGQLPHFYQNSARYRNQINQAVLYMSKILDAKSAEQWNNNGNNQNSWNGFVNFITETAEMLENTEDDGPRLKSNHSLIIAGMLGIAGIILYRYMF